MFLSSRFCWFSRTSGVTWTWRNSGSKGRWGNIRTPRSTRTSRTEGSTRVGRFAWGNRKQRNDRWIIHICLYLFFRLSFSFMSSVTLISVMWYLPRSSSHLLSLSRNCLYRPECSSTWSQNLILVNRCFSGLTFKWPMFAHVNKRTDAAESSFYFHTRCCSFYNFIFFCCTISAKVFHKPCTKIWKSTQFTAHFPMIHFNIIILSVYIFQQVPFISYFPIKIPLYFPILFWFLFNLLCVLQHFPSFLVLST